MSYTDDASDWPDGLGDLGNVFPCRIKCSCMRLNVVGCEVKELLLCCIRAHAHTIFIVP